MVKKVVKPVATNDTPPSTNGVKVSRRKLSDYKFDPANPRKDTPRGRTMLENSVSEFGPARSGVVDKSGVIRAGNHTAEQLYAAGIEEVIEIETTGKEWVVVKRTDMDSKTGKKYSIADNRSGELGEYDADVLAGFADEGIDLAQFWNDDELAALLGDDGETTPAPDAQMDKAEELQGKWQVQRGDMFTIGDHRLLCGDSTNADDVARVMAGEKADCVFTSPPYAVGIDYGEYQDTIANLRKMLPLLSKIWHEIVCSGGFAVINFADIVSGKVVINVKEPCEYPMALEYWPVFRADGWSLWSRRVWCKPTARVSSLQCINTNRAATDFEHVWTWLKAGDPIVKQISGTVNGWFDSTELEGVAEDKSVHGAGMPTGVAVRMIGIHSRINKPIFEPFCGTGTTLVACEQTKRCGRGIEISEKYCSVILERMSQMSGITPQKVTHG